MDPKPVEHRVTAALVLAATCLLFGATIGLMTVQLFAADPPTGWKSIPNAFGGIIIGGLLGLVAGGYLARDLSVTARWWSSAVAVVLAAGTLWSIALTVN